MQSIIDVPLHLARLAPTERVCALQTDSHIIFGGLIKEDKAEISRLKKEFWSVDQNNGALMPASSEDIRRFPFSFHADSHHVWVPNQNVIEGAVSSALSTFDVGTVRWFGALGSENNPLHAKFKLHGNDEWIGENNGWSWAEASAALMDAAGIKRSDPALVAAIESEAKKMFEGVMREYREVEKGNVFGIVVYGAEIGKHRRDESLDYELWGLVGKTYATESLHMAMREAEIACATAQKPTRAVRSAKP